MCKVHEMNVHKLAISFLKELGTRTALVNILHSVFISGVLSDFDRLKKVNMDRKDVRRYSTHTWVGQGSNISSYLIKTSTFELWAEFTGTFFPLFELRFGGVLFDLPRVLSKG